MKPPLYPLLRKVGEVIEFYDRAVYTPPLRGGVGGGYKALCRFFTAQRNIFEGIIH